MVLESLTSNPTLMLATGILIGAVVVGVLLVVALFSPIRYVFIIGASIKVLREALDNVHDIVDGLSKAMGGFKAIFKGIKSAGKIIKNGKKKRRR